MAAAPAEKRRRRRPSSEPYPEIAAYWRCVLRETFAYAGGTRDPFNSLINQGKNGPEISDLDLVGVYLDLRTPSNNVVVLREKRADGKRHKMRVGDQLGRSRLTQIRARDAVFTIQDFGFDRQETLSLRKQEVETP